MGMILRPGRLTGFFIRKNQLNHPFVNHPVTAGHEDFTEIDYFMAADPCFRAVTVRVEDVNVLSIAGNRQILTLKADREDH